jgi:tetratricopeptide (TPR) repeat protein
MLMASLAIVCLLAQDAHPAPHSADAKAKARVLLKQGARHYQRAEFGEALADFQRAYETFASPKLLLNIGQVSRDLGRPVEAITAFEQFLEQATDAPERALAEARQSIEELDPQVGKLRIDCLPGADLSVDGIKVGISPIKKPIHVMPGAHEVRALVAATPPLVKRVNIDAGRSETVVLRPAPVLSRTVVQRRGLAVGDTGLASRAAKPRPEEGWMLGRKWTWLAAGSAVAFAGGAAAAGFMMRSKFEALDQRCGRSAGTNYSGCSPDDLRTVDTWKNTANVLWGLSAAAAVTSGVLFYVEGRTVAVAPMPGPMVGLQASVRY